MRRFRRSRRRFACSRCPVLSVHDAPISAFTMARFPHQTAHKWINRFKQSGYDGLEEHSRRPQGTPLATAEDVVVAIVKAREAHPRWGQHKLQVFLQRRFGEKTPTERTIARVLKRFDMVRRRRPRPSLNVVTQAPSVEVTAPNDLWTVDYKGWWRAGNGERCEPLTVRDAFSRCVLALQVFPSTKLAHARPVFERLFKRCGIPKRIQSDNGTPFISVTSRAGLTELSAWWIALGIEIIRSRPGCPQDNGGHERMHLDIAQEVESIPCAGRDSQQRACDRWRQEFNHVRPHDALNDKTPAEVYKPSSSRVRERVALYPSDWLVRKVSCAGHIRVDSEQYFLSGPLRGRCVGLQPVDALHWRAWYYEVDLGLIEIAPNQLPDKLTGRASKATSVPTCSNVSSVRARKKRAPATPRLTHSARVSPSRVSKQPVTKRSRSKRASREK
jgi:putative transposase